MALSNSELSDTERLLPQLARYEALFEAVPLAVAVFDDALRLTRANARYRELTSTSGNEPVQIYDAFPNALADLSDQIDAAINGEKWNPIRVPFQQPGGQRVVEVGFLPIEQALDTKGVVFIAGDVTEREQLREDLARSVAQLETIFDVIPDSVRVFDADGNITRMNSQAQLDHGLNAPRNLLDLWQQDRPRSLDGVTLFMHEHPTARAIRGELVRSQTIAVRRGTDASKQVIEVNSNPLRDETGRIRGAVTVERNVTERTRLAQELEEQVRRSAALYERVSTEAERLERMVAARTQELMELQEARSRDRRLAAVGQLAAGVMHDVNNALNPIMAAAYLLEVNAEDPSAVRDYAARIAKAAETGAATAARVGRFIRQDPIKGSDEDLVNLSVVAEEVVAMTRSLWAERAQGGRIELVRDFSPGVIVSGIAGEIREALLNLIQNALDAMRGGGTLGLVTRVAGNEAYIEVRDSGGGMSAEVRDRAFEPFFTTKGTGGSGLGLSEVYGIAKRHRGRAEIESELKSGTTVRLVFPLMVPATNLPDPEEKPRSAKTVLLVEDNIDGREFMRALLESDGHTVKAVGTMHEALARLAPGGVEPPYQVLVTDIGLPDGSGWDLVTAARARWPEMRIGVVTGWEVRAGPANTVDFNLRKPVRAQELLSQVGEDD